MEDDPYLDMIDEQRPNILMMYQMFRGKDQIIQYDVGEEKIYSYPAHEYIQNLSERTRDHDSTAICGGHKTQSVPPFH